MAIINGTNGDDRELNSLFGTNADDQIFGFAGNDWIFGSLGSDLIDGGEDYDVAIYDNALFNNGVFINNTGSAVTETWNGISTTVGSFSVDKAVIGTDSLVGIESFNASQGNDIVYLSDPSTGVAYVFDRAGDDKIVADQTPGSGYVVFYAGSGNDQYIGSIGNVDRIDYRTGAIDNIDAAGPQIQGAVVTFTGIGTGFATDPWGDTDTFSGVEAITGSDLNDTLHGGPGDDFLDGAGGDDEINGNDGSDTINGGDGADTLRGGAESDVIHGGDGFDFLDGGEGDDFLYADGEGFVYGGAGDDFLDGELFYEPASGGVIINMSYSDQTVDGMLVLARTAIDEFGDTDTFSASVQFGHSSPYDDVVFGSDVGSFFFLRAGDDVMYAGGGDDLIYAGSGNDILDGGAGDFDTVSYYDDGYDLAGPATSGVVVDLQSGTATDGWGDSDLLTNFESVEGSNFSDDISGDANNNYLSGLDGNDVLSGRAGADFLYGGSGDDFIDGGSGNDVIHGGDGNDQIYGGDGNDVITDGNIGDSDNDDYIDAGAGDDTIINNGGTDTFIGGEGSDTLVTDVTTLPADYTLLFDTVAGVHGRLEASPFPNDTIDGIENFTLIGSWDSQVTGGDEANRFQTDLGDDVISSGAGDDTILSGGGNDILDGGGGGFDTVSYYYDAYYGSTTPATSGVVVDLQSGTATDGWGYLDLVTNFEAVEGSNLADDISGDNNNNYLSGFDGNDSLSGRAGADFLDGGSGNDELTGGKGVDTFMFADGYGHDVILDLETSKVPASASGRLPPIVNTGLGDNNAALGDNIDMTGLTAVEEFQDILDAASQVGNDVVMTFGADVLTLENFALSGLYDDMFIF